MTAAQATPSLVALIPARSGSKRITQKNVKFLAGHPLLAYSIAAARESGVFSAIIVSTDSAAYAEIARYYGAEVPFLRPAELAGDLSPDIEWIEYTLGRLAAAGRIFDCFSILRPTNPFRQADTIRRAWQQFLSQPSVDSLRAVELCSQHPGKMWVVRGDRMTPLLPLGPAEQPWHSSQYQALPQVYAQNASLEIAWTRVVSNGRTIAGQVVMPFFTTETEGVDLNRPRDWFWVEELLRSGAELPRVNQAPYQITDLEKIEVVSGVK